MRISKWECFEMMIDLCLVKDKRVENAHLKFYTILVVLQFLVELPIEGGQCNKSSVCKKNKNEHSWLPPILREY